MQPGDLEKQEFGLDIFSNRTVSHRLGLALCGLISLASLGWALDVYRELGMSFMNEQFFAMVMAIALPAVLLMYRADRSDLLQAAPIYDWLLALVGFANGVYVAIYYPDILDRLYTSPEDAVIAGSVFVGLIAEGLRRTAGKVLFLFLMFILLFGFFSHYLPFNFRGEEISYARYVVFLGLDSNGLLGLALKVSTTMITAFLLFGFVLEKAGGAEFFTDFSKSVVGAKRGGSAKIAIVASSLFGSISGSAVSNVVSTGVVTIPLMRRSGYSNEDSAGVEAVASTGGQLMPPMMGIAAFLMAEILQRPYSEIVIAAIIPALLYYIALFTHVDLLAVRDRIKPLQASQIGKLGPIFSKGWLFFIPFVVIIMGLFTFNLQPETAAVYGSVSLLPIGLFLGYGTIKLSLRDALPILVRAGQAALEIMMISAAAGIIIGVLNISGLGFALTLELVYMLDGNLLILLLVVASMSIVLGMGMPTVGVYLLLATLLAPSIVESGIPALAAHLFVFYFGIMSLITPPVAIAAFTAATLARADAFKTVWAAVRFGWVAYLIPFLVVASPVMIMDGTWPHIAASFVTAVAGVWFVTATIVGVWRGPMNVMIRSAFLVGGLLLIVPTDLGTLAIAANVIGVVLAVVLIASSAFGQQRLPETCITVV
ncbi:MAG: TRAP transporter fused permease subunit [Pseudomonadota bacterium]|nr:TRAP transporter fused permease subunit [Pseudomonadota bacterium]